MDAVKSDNNQLSHRLLPKTKRGTGTIRGEKANNMATTINSRRQRISLAAIVATTSLGWSVGLTHALLLSSSSSLTYNYPESSKKRIRLHHCGVIASPPTQRSSCIHITTMIAMGQGEEDNNEEQQGNSDNYDGNDGIVSNSNTPTSSLDSNSLFMEQFRRRRGRVELKQLQNQWSRPPNTFLSPTEFVSGVLAELKHPRGQYSGVLTLLESSTVNWQQTLSKSVGAPIITPSSPTSNNGDDNNNDITMTTDLMNNQQLAPTLEAALSRPGNQFAILLGVENRDYVIDFPTDPLEDYDEGTCWLECRLRGGYDDELLVVLGWSLKQRASDKAWLIDTLDWQDFRELYRPGIGREEWERICG